MDVSGVLARLGETLVERELEGGRVSIHYRGVLGRSQGFHTSGACPEAINEDAGRVAELQGLAGIRALDPQKAMRSLVCGSCGRGGPGGLLRRWEHLWRSAEVLERVEALHKDMEILAASLRENPEEGFGESSAGAALVTLWAEADGIHRHLTVMLDGIRLERAGLESATVEALRDLKDAEHARARAFTNTLVEHDSLLNQGLREALDGPAHADQRVDAEALRWVGFAPGSQWWAKSAAVRALSTRYRRWSAQHGWIGLAPESLARAAEKHGGQSCAVEGIEAGENQAFLRLSCELLAAGRSLEDSLRAAGAAVEQSTSSQRVAGRERESTLLR